MNTFNEKLESLAPTRQKQKQKATQERKNVYKYDDKHQKGFRVNFKAFVISLNDSKIFNQP